MEELSDGMFKTLLPIAIQWAEEKYEILMKRGIKLSPLAMQDARLAGIRYPERVRVIYIHQIPRPSMGLLKLANDMMHLVTDQSTGLPISYGIYLREDCREDRAALLHEMIHVAQYEKLGGITPFFTQYLSECLHHGYAGAPLEKEAVESTALLLP
jgi:hypothetical protein